MTHASHGKLVADWMAAHPFSEFIPLNLIPPARPLASPDARSDELHREADIKLNQSSDHRQRTTYKLRRHIEARLAEYLKQFMDVFSVDRVLREAPDKLCACRRSGHWGERTSGDRSKLVVGWDYKCGLTRLCPDESRAEQRRLVKRYKPVIRAWIDAAPAKRRIQKGVVTWPNIPPGELAKFKRLMCKEFAALLKQFPQVRGALISQEDPLSTHGDWNVHLNIVLLIEGRFDWMTFIERWTERTRHLFPNCEAEHFQIKMRELPRFSSDALDAALRECIKYAVKHQDMSDLDPHRFLEWWNAGLRFRRTRSYGVLFRVPKPDRVFSETVWYGRVWWDGSLKSGVYAVETPQRTVSSTQANNFPWNKPRGTSFSTAGPPPS